MSARDTLVVLAREFAFMLEPLAAALDADSAEVPGALRDFLHDLGWTFPQPPSALTALREPISQLLALVTITEDSAEPDAPEVFARVRALYQSLAALGSASELPADFRAEFPRQLVDDLSVRYVLDNQPCIGGLLQLLGIVSIEKVAASGTRPAYSRRSFDWEGFGSLLRDPLPFLRNVYRWGQSDFDSARLFAGMARLLEGANFTADASSLDANTSARLNAGALAPATAVSAFLRWPILEASLDPRVFSAGLGLFALPETQTAKPGVAVLPFTIGRFNQTTALSERLRFSLEGNVDLSGGGGILVRPSRDPEFVLGLGGSAPVPATGQLGLRLSLARSDEPVTLLGSPNASRVEVAGISTTIGTRFNAQAQRDLFAELRMEQARIVIAPAPEDTDGFLSQLLPAGGLSLTLDPTIGVSSDRGLYFEGSGALEVTLPTHATLGPLEIGATRIAIKPAGTTVPVEIGVTVKGDFGLLRAVVENVGLRASFTFPANRDGNLGPLQFDLGFMAPQSVGLTLDAHGVITGGGALIRDPAHGLYAGVMQLSLHDKLTLTAYGLIQTRMPDGRPGYSVLVFITAEGFQPIPLGWGFMLTGIGGMVGIHRTFDREVLKAGLNNNTLAQLLFPRDPASNPLALIESLAAAFPARHGSYLLGLLARITWFSPPLVHLDLALILELGNRERLLLLGRISALLPSAENDLIRLNMNAIGVLDFDQGTLEADAVIVDSRLCHQFPITGSGAVRARWSDAGNFVMAAGGLNPRFRAPAGFPVLDRVAIALCAGRNPRLICDAYFAITANTVQFGSRVSLYAEALGFSVSGDLGFDALITLLPPHFVVDIHAIVQLRRGSHNLFKVTLDGILEGPLPLRLAARAKFEIFWFSFTVHFDYTLVGGSVQIEIPAVRVIDAVKRALSDPTNWTARAPYGIGHGVALRAVPQGGATTLPTLLDPLGELVVQQSVAPLNTTRVMDTFGGAPIDGPGQLSLTGALNNRAGTNVSAEFAPTRHFTMSDDDKLAAPSFDTMDAGLVLGAGPADFSTATIVAAALEYEAITLNPAPATAPAPPRATERYALPADAFTKHLPYGAAARAPARQIGRARFRTAEADAAVRENAIEWRLQRINDGVVAPVDPTRASWTEQRAVLAALNRGGVEWQMLPAHELDVA